MKKFIVTITVVEVRSELEHVNAYSLMGKLSTSLHEHIDHRHVELHSINIVPAAVVPA
jgi:hypothetical protein